LVKLLLKFYIEAVKIYNCISKDFLVSSVVACSSHLGPFLFILFINVFPPIFDSFVDIILFADDAKIFSIIISPNDTLKLQLNLNKFVQCSRIIAYH